VTVSRSPVRIAGSGLVLGVLWGAILGVTVLAVVAVFAPLLIFFTPVAAIVGAALGGVDGLVAGVVLMLARASLLANRRRARLIAAGAAATPPLFLILLSLIDRHVGGWAWWLFVGGLASAAGALLGPRVVYGKRPASADKRTRDGGSRNTCLGRFA
jgi:hypothetical protein